MSCEASGSLFICLACWRLATFEVLFMTEYLDALQRSFRLADAVDIVLVAVFIYALLIWFKSTASRPILVGMGVLAIIYSVARSFDMYMTSALYQAGLTVAAVAAVVVFQEDLRRTFAGLASLWSLPRKRVHVADSDLDIVVEIVFELAAKKIGALIAICGNEPLDRHLRGGVHLDARISKALLDSIFDPHSMGHDGAVIVDRDRISVFAARLPLSENSKQIDGRGTRHCAGLGLTELCDARVIVVSEERGHVNLAERGKFHRMESPVELKQRLDGFIRRCKPLDAKGLGRRLLVSNGGLKLIALVVASLGWFFTSLELRTVQRTFSVPIEYRNLPEAMDIKDSDVTEAKVTLDGFQRAFNLLNPSSLRLSLDLSQIEPGAQAIAIDKSDLNLPPNLTFLRSVPRSIAVDVESWTAKMLKVEVNQIGRLAPHLRKYELTPAPDKVMTQVWRSLRDQTNVIYTNPVNVGQVTESASMRVKLAVPEHIRLESDQATEVEIRLEVGHEKPIQNPDAP